MQRLFLTACLLFCSGFVLAQQPPALQPGGGGPAPLNASDELTPAQRQAIVAMLKENTARLERQNLLPAPSSYKTALLAFAWPLKQATGFSDNGYYGITNYVDENKAYPNQVLDYNCGDRTYDQANGYNHAGTDIFIWPFPWQKMAQNAVQIVAAAPGVIIGKSDGNYDQNCAFCSGSCNWNAVYVQHADGSVAWYGHMKTGSLTAKAVGQSVALGEYLGAVGSSGNSTGPHLHFEVYTSNAYTQLVDPWAGPCNALNGFTSWWAAQQAYRVPTLNKIMTHGSEPASGTCPGSESVNQRLNFLPGQTLYVGSYYRDNLNGTSATHRLYRPDNSLWASWTQNFTATYNVSWWWYSRTLPSSGGDGVWRYEVTYNGQTLSTNFGVSTVLPLDLVYFTATKQGRRVALSWATENENNAAGFAIERSTDGNLFTTVGSLAAVNKPERAEYRSRDENAPYGKLLYRLRMIDNDGRYRFSNTAVIEMQKETTGVEAWPNAFANSLRITLTGDAENILLRMVNASGQTVWEKAAARAGTQWLLTDGYAKGLYVLLVYEGGQLVQKRKLMKP